MGALSLVPTLCECALQSLLGNKWKLLNNLNVVMEKIYLTPFVFRATRFEEYQDGVCSQSGSIDVQIVSIIKENIVLFHLEGEMPMRMKRNFGVPFFGVAQGGDILKDRIVYGRLPNSLSWHDSTDPLVCEIFSSKTCIRFAMLSPLRIIEFSGHFQLIGGYN